GQNVRGAHRAGGQCSSAHLKSGTNELRSRLLECYGACHSSQAMSYATTELPRRSFGQTMRSDIWWRQPLLVFLGLSAFIVYSTWAAFQGTHYFFGNYISPFYSPEIFGDSPHSWFGAKPGWWPGWLLFS